MAIESTPFHFKLVFLNKMKMNTCVTKKLGNEGKPKNQTRNPNLPKNCKIFCHRRKADILRKIEEIVGHREKGDRGDDR